MEIKELGLLIKSKRKAMSLTQEEFAMTANVSPKLLFNLEKGKSNISFEALTRVVHSAGLVIEIKDKS